MSLTMRDLHPVSLPDLVRLGRWDDGGYVVPRSSITEAKTLYSFGVNDDISFEAAAYKINPSISIHCYDPSVSTRILSARALKLLVKGVIQGATGKLMLALRDFSYPKRVVDFAGFFRQPNVHFIRKKVWYASNETSVCLEDVFSSHVKSGDLFFVKMDIEGSEYRVIRQLLPYLDNISGIAVEFHDVDIHLDKIAAIVEELKNKFYVAHVHGNNITGYVHDTNIPMTLELTFASKSLYKDEPPLSDQKYPRQGLDWPNHHASPDIPISFDA